MPIHPSWASDPFTKHTNANTVLLCHKQRMHRLLTMPSNILLEKVMTINWCDPIETSLSIQVKLGLSPHFL